MVSAKPYKGQKYQKIKKECIRKKTLFRDSEFPPEGPSLFYSKAAPADIHVVWKRPGVGILLQYFGVMTSWTYKLQP